MIPVSAMAVLLFLGGWDAPWPAPYGSGFVPAVIFFLAGAVALYHGLHPARKRDRLTLTPFGIIFFLIAGLFLLPMVQSWLLPLFWFLAKGCCILVALIWVL